MVAGKGQALAAATRGRGAGCWLRFIALSSLVSCAAEMPRGTKPEQTGCAVGCTNSYANIDKAGEYIQFHRFPSAITVDDGLARTPAANDGPRCVKLHETHRLKIAVKILGSAKHRKEKENKTGTGVCKTYNAGTTCTIVFMYNRPSIA